MFEKDNTIHPRNLRFGISSVAQRHWFGGDIYTTAFCDCLSLFLPDGERFFIKSVLHYKDRIDDPKLLEDIKNFVAQEAFHTREHEDYNKGLALLGYDLELMEGRVKKKLQPTKKPILRLAATCAIEHLTATFSDQILRDPTYFDNTPDAYRDIWLWHALEETEHKSVAIDVFNVVTRDMPAWKRYALRVGALMVVSKGFLVTVLQNCMSYLRTDGEKIGVKTVYSAFWRLFINPGFFRRGALYYLRYYVPGFHPSHCDNYDLLEKWRARIPAKSETRTP